MTLPASVESTTDVWGALPADSAIRDPQSEFSEQLPRSTVAPPPVDRPAEDYDSIIAELHRLENKCQALKMRITLLDFAEPVGGA
jgi:hypothetical protein